MATTKMKNVAKMGLLSMVLLLTACNEKEKNTVPTNTDSDMKTAETTIVDYKTDPNLDVEVKTFLKGLNSGGTPLEKLTPKEAKDVLVNAQAGVKVNRSGIEVSEKTITSDGFTIALNIVRPKGAKEKLPVFIFIHGGGWILGDFPTHERLVRDLVVHSGFAAVFVNYTRTPEAKYPVAINEIFAATKWVAAHGDEINVDGTNMAVVGNSVGGNMTAVTALKAKENNGPKIKGLIMMWPIVDSKFDTESYKKFGQDRFLTVPIMKWMYDFYIPNPEDRNVIYASPLQATVDQLKGLPPTLIQTAENDILRDEGEAFGRKLNEAGVKVSTVRYNGMIHDFGLLNGLATLPAVNALTVQAGAQLKDYLKK
jgi:acetyl esterase